MFLCSQPHGGKHNNTFSQSLPTRRNRRCHPLSSSLSHVHNIGNSLKTHSWIQIVTRSWLYTRGFKLNTYSVSGAKCSINILLDNGFILGHLIRYPSEFNIIWALSQYLLFLPAPISGPPWLMAKRDLPHLLGSLYKPVCFQDDWCLSYTQLGLIVFSLSFDYATGRLRLAPTVSQHPTHHALLIFSYPS